MGAAWESAPGANLTLSIIFQPRWLRPDRQFAWGQAVALAVAHTAAEWVSEGDPCVKWPNDVLIGTQKVAGILIENTVSGSFIAHSIVGIGLNVHQLQFSPNLTQAASLQSFTREELSIDAIQARLFAHLENAYERLERGDERGIHREYLDRLFAFGQVATFLAMPEGRAFSGRIVNVDTDGKLCIETEEGMRRFGQKEIKFTFAAP
jgi:BirA family biotin operon repressor/biotin-[acetyl-CoA-carboxylase] ligase